MTARDLQLRARANGQRVATRIAASPHTVVLEYPPAPPSVVSEVRQTPPNSPLTGRNPGHTLQAPAAPTPTLPSLTLPCLWYTAASLGDLRRGGLSVGPTGWVEGAEAMAVVTADYGRSVFRGTAAIEHNVEDGSEGRYTLLKVTPLGPGFAAPHSFALWLQSRET